MTEREAYIALNMVQGIGAVTVANGTAKFGSALAFFSAGADKLASLRGMNRAAADELARAFASVDWRSEMEKASEHSVSFLTPVDSGYPPLLKNIT